MSTTARVLKNLGVYNELNLDEYDAHQSYLGSYTPNRDEMFVHELGDLHGRGELRLVGKRELAADDAQQAEQQRWLGLLEALTVGEQIAENLEPIMPVLFQHRLYEIDRQVTSWERFNLGANKLQRTDENQDILRAVWLAGAYAVNQGNLHVVTDAPSKRDDADALRRQGVGYVADLAGFSIANVDGYPDVHAVATGRYYELGVLSHPVTTPADWRSTVLVEQPATLK